MNRYRKQAVALAYGHNPTPIVTAKGDEALAERIVEEARAHGVMIAQDPQLLQLLSRIDIDQEIPPELYTAVAVLLSWVYWLKGMRPGDEQASEPGPDSAPHQAS
jgi:flagellar biosynthesis protein